MNLYKNIPRTEGVETSYDSYIVAGKSYKKIKPMHILYMGETAEVGTEKRDGWYLTINLPFIKKKRKYMCPYIFEIKEDVCTPVFMLRIRKMGKNKYYSAFKVFVWRPLNQVKEQIKEHL